MSFRRAADRYRIGAQIYKQDACTIYEAVEVATNRPVIIKALITEGEDQTNSILDESTIQMKLQHTHICEVLGVYISGTTVNIVLERMKSDLEAEVKTRQIAFCEPEIVEILRQVATALCFAKERHIAHRDIKPANIFVAKDGFYKVGDLGSALQVVSSRNMKHTLIGTPIYLSPQLTAGYLAAMMSGDSQVEYDPFKADVYALGMTALYIARGGNLAGLLPFQSKVDIQGLVTELRCSDWLKQLLLGMLQEEERNRFDMEYVLNYIQPTQPQNANPQVHANAAGSGQTMPPPVISPHYSQTIQPPPYCQTVQPDQYYQTVQPDQAKNSHCVFCNILLDRSKRQFQFQMNCGHLACTKFCYENYTYRGYSCLICQANKAQHQ